MSLEIEPSRDPAPFFALEQAMGWPRQLPEIARRFVVAEGFLAREGDDVVGSATLALYRGANDATRLAWVGGMAVRPERRRRGVGRALLGACLARAEEAGAESIGLDATEGGRALYEKLGFEAVARTPRWTRVVGAPALPSDARHAIHPISLSEAMEIGAFDEARFGAKRLPFLLAILHDQPWRAFMARDKATGEVTGFALGQARVIGPVVADDEGAAGALVAACELAGAPPVVTIDERNERASLLLASMGYAPDGASCLRMKRGGALPMDPERTFALAAWAMG